MHHVMFVQYCHKSFYVVVIRKSPLLGEVAGIFLYQINRLIIRIHRIDFFGEQFIHYLTFNF